jgi:hypothetical protein
VSIRKFLFLDDRNVDRLDNARLVVNPPARHPQNPIFSAQTGMWDKSRGEDGRLFTVMYDREEKLFKAWYEFGTCSYFVGPEVKPYRHMAYATSADGIHWERPSLGQVDWNGSRNNNLLAGTVPWVIFKDPSEAIPERRYKGVFTHDASEAFAAGLFCPVCCAFSADGVHWNVPKVPYSRDPDPLINRPVNPIVPEGTDAVHAYSWYWDPYIRRYVGMMRPGWNVPRRICMAESDDFVHWTPRRTILEPDDRDPPHHREFHGMHVMRYEEYWVGLMQVYHTMHEGWYAFHEIEPDAPPWMETFSLQLTYSRDGRNWLRAGNRQTFLAGTGDDAFDASLIIGVHQPFVHDDKIWIYYSGCPDRHTYPEHRRRGIDRAGGLAQLRLDGFVSVDADSAGTCTSDRLDIIPTQILLNAQAKGGSIRVEALDPFHRPIKDFGVEQAVPFSDDSLSGAVRWKHGRSLADITESLYGGIRLKFYLERAKLYSFTLRRDGD